MVARQTLTLFVWVQVLDPQPCDAKRRSDMCLLARGIRFACDMPFGRGIRFTSERTYHITANLFAIPLRHKPKYHIAKGDISQWWRRRITSHVWNTRKRCKKCKNWQLPLGKNRSECYWQIWCRLVAAHKWQKYGCIAFWFYIDINNNEVKSKRIGQIDFI